MINGGGNIMGFFGSIMNALSGSGQAEIPKNAIFIDVRSQGEVASGAMEGAINIPLAEISGKAKKLPSEKSKPIVVFCASGMRSGMARKALLSLGYEQVINGGGISSLAMRLGKRII